MTDQLVQRIIPTVPGMGRGLVNHDPRSLDHPATAGVPDGAPPRSRTWRRGGPYDQGETPECVAFTGKGLLNTTPNSTGVTYYSRRLISTETLYVGAKRNDEWDGEDYDGTSALGLCRYLVSVGRIRGYSWARSLEELILGLGYVGPFGLGVMWKAGMMRPDSHGRITATGSDVGGHEIEAVGVDLKAGGIILEQSWGPDWGRNGRALLPFSDTEDRLADQGDAVTLHV